MWWRGEIGATDARLYGPASPKLYRVASGCSSSYRDWPRTYFFENARPGVTKRRFPPYLSVSLLESVPGQVSMYSTLRQLKRLGCGVGLRQRRGSRVYAVWSIHFETVLPDDESRDAA